MIATDLVRLFAGVAVLGFASWTDWRWRRAPDVLWLALGAVGLAALAADLVVEPSRVADWPYLAAAPAFAAAMWLLWRFGLLAGGADAKALIALAFLLPWPIAVGPLPIVRTGLPGSFAVLGDTLLAFLAIPIAFFVRNAAHGAFRLPHALVGIRVPIDALDATPAWPMERFEEGRVVTRFFAHRAPESPPGEVRDGLRAAGRTATWIAPKIPFMIPLFVGFVLAFTAGDLLTWIVFTLSGASP